MFCFQILHSNGCHPEPRHCGIKDDPENHYSQEKYQILIHDEKCFWGISSPNATST